MDVDPVPSTSTKPAISAAVFYRPLASLKRENGGKSASDDESDSEGNDAPGTSNAPQKAVTPPRVYAGPLQAIPTSTPVSHKTSGHYAHGSLPFGREEYYRELEEETRGKYVGPVKPEDFLDRYLPASPQATTKRQNLKKKKLSEVRQNAKREKDMYKPFIDVIYSYAPTLQFVNTGDHGDNDLDQISVDVSTYSLTNQGKVMSHSDFSRMEVPIEFKYEDSRDLFVDPADPEKPLEATPDDPFPFERRAEEAKLDRGQVASYATAVMGTQFRLHVFVVFICGKWARLMRWDRNGAIVTEKFNYAEERHLVDFFSRYSAADSCVRGHDPTVTVSTEEDLKATKNKTAGQDRLIKANKRHREFRTMLIPDREDASKEFRFLISYPLRHSARSPFGRATRPMLAFDLEKDKPVFVKDYWRAVGDGLEKEGDIYTILEAKKVPHIAPFGRGNDVRKHFTLTDTNKTKLKHVFPTKSMGRLRQYRMSLDVIGRRLVDFNSTYELVKAIADGMEAHEWAYHDGQILHRDISVGNIIITDEGEGLLIDWDLCLNLTKQPTEARRFERTGTWQFMSCGLLAYPGKLQDKPDDQESSLYILTWTVLRYTKHSQLARLQYYLKPYDEFDPDPGQSTGGRLKRDFLSQGMRAVKFTDRPSLDDLIDELRLHFHDCYTLQEPSAEEVEELEEMKRLGITKGLHRNETYKYEILQKRLKNRKWLVATFRKHLANGPWPENDAAELNELHPPDGKTHLKRTSDYARFVDRPGSSKSGKLSVSSGANSRAASSPTEADVPVSGKRAKSRATDSSTGGSQGGGASRRGGSRGGRSRAGSYLSENDS